MKGIVLAGGIGSRLSPLTRVTNKHLLPIYEKLMVYYLIQTLVNAEIEEILLVTGGRDAGEFLRQLGNGRDFGLKHINYTYQEAESGIAEPLGLRNTSRAMTRSASSWATTSAKTIFVRPWRISRCRVKARRFCQRK